MSVGLYYLLEIFMGVSIRKEDMSAPSIQPLQAPLGCLLSCHLPLMECLPYIVWR